MNRFPEISEEQQLHSRYVEKMYNRSLEDGWSFLEELKPNEAGDAGLLVRSPKPVIIATSLYIIFVCIIGPRFMKYREPFQLKTIIRFYNLAMVFLAGVLLLKLYDAIGTVGSFFESDKVFTLQDTSASSVYRMADLILMVRISEYLDTIFFTLRKKDNQVTFLHVFHHAFVPMYAYWILRTAPMRFNIFIIFINSFIHVLMYFYYFLATFQERPSQTGPSTSSGSRKPAKKVGFVMFIINKVLMFKRYMTQLQIIQFFLLAFYVVITALRPNHCSVPWTYLTSNLLLAATFIGLFVHFYLTAYNNANSTGKASTQKTKDN